MSESWAPRPANAPSDPDRRAPLRVVQSQVHEGEGAAGDDPPGPGTGSGSAVPDASGRRLSLDLVHAVPGRVRVRGRGLRTATPAREALVAECAGHPHVHSVRLNPAAGSLVVVYEPAALSAAGLGALLGLATPPTSRAHAERNVSPGSADAEDGTAGEAGKLVELALTLVGLVGLSLLPRAAGRLLTYALIAPTLARGARSFVADGVSMEMLDSLAVGLATIQGKFGTALTTHGLLTLGEHLEHNTERHTDELLQRLLQPIPGKAWVHRGGSLVELAVDDIAVGDQVEVGPGDMLPVDGKVIAGTASVNEASITGEPLSARKEPGDRVLSGTLVEDGRIRVRATRVGSDTTTARIRRFIEHSLQTQSTTQRRAAYLADRRVYLTLGLGALVFLTTRSLERLASVFLVDYACALKLGTPVAIKAAMYRGARNGVLFRGGQAIESLAEADAFVFDKTGTLTTGFFEVHAVTSLDPAHWSRDDILALVASLEEHVNHPLADAVVDQARRDALAHVEHEDVDYLVAHGLTTQVLGGKRVAVGSRHFLEEHEGVRFEPHQSLLRELERHGEHLLYVALEGALLGVIALQDAVRPEASSMISALRQRRPGARLILLTGDRWEKAESLNRSLGLDRVVAECSPESKAEFVRELKKDGKLVAFVGDGVNDAPALTEAAVGIAMPKSSDLARATADVVLTQDDLATLLRAEHISRGTMRLIERQFTVSTVSNTVVILGAAFGLFSPVASALLHNGTTIGVLLNAMAGARSPADNATGNATTG